MLSFWLFRKKNEQIVEFASSMKGVYVLFLFLYQMNLFAFQSITREAVSRHRLYIVFTS